MFNSTSAQANWGPQDIEGMQGWRAENYALFFYSLLYFLLTTANLCVLK
jgi:hypothetical protein